MKTINNIKLYNKLNYFFNFEEKLFRYIKYSALSSINQSEFNYRFPYNISRHTKYFYIKNNCKYTYSPLWELSGSINSIRARSIYRKFRGYYNISEDYLKNKTVLVCNIEKKSIYNDGPNNIYIGLNISNEELNNEDIFKKPIKPYEIFFFTNRTYYFYDKDFLKNDVYLDILNSFSRKVCSIYY